MLLGTWEVFPKQKLWNFLFVHEWGHNFYIKNVTKVTQTLQQNVTNMTKQNIKSKEIPTIEFHRKYMKLFVKMLSIICVYLLNTKFHNTSENFYFEVILVQDLVLCKVTNVTNRYMNFILDLDKEFNFQRPVCLDSNRKHCYQSKIFWSHVCTRSCSHSKVKLSTFLVTTWPWNGPITPFRLKTIIVLLLLFFDVWFPKSALLLTLLYKKKTNLLTHFVAKSEPLRRFRGA